MIYKHDIGMLLFYRVVVIYSGASYGSSQWLIRLPCLNKVDLIWLDLRHGSSFELSPPTKTTTFASKSDVLLILTTTKRVRRNTLSSLNLLTVNNSSHLSDDVLIEEKWHLKQANDFWFWRPNKHACDWCINTIRVLNGENSYFIKEQEPFGLL